MSDGDWPADWRRSPELAPDGCTLVAPGIAYSWGGLGYEPDHLLVWHWCDHRLWLAQGRDPELVGAPYWSPGGVGLHELVSRSPLHLEPSLYWSDCCGVHGWLRDGRWQSA